MTDNTITDEQKSAFVAKIKDRLKLPASATPADVFKAVDDIRERAASLTTAQVAQAAAALTPDETALFAEVYGDKPQASALTADEAALYASVYIPAGGNR